MLSDDDLVKSGALKLSSFQLVKKTRHGLELYDQALKTIRTRDSEEEKSSEVMWQPPNHETD